MLVAAIDPSLLFFGWGLAFFVTLTSALLTLIWALDLGRNVRKGRIALEEIAKAKL